MVTDIVGMPFARVPFPPKLYYTLLLRDWMHWFYGTILQSPATMAALPHVPHLSLGTALAAMLGTAFSVLMVIALVEILPERRRAILTSMFGSFETQQADFGHRSLGEYYPHQLVE